jgi:hypothetical protein
MWNETAQKIEAIHAMMATGHRSVRVEWHTLVLWGVAAAVLILLVRTFFTPEMLPVHWQRILASNLFISLTLIVVGIWDYRLTQRARSARDETLSFIQQQVIKIWWLMAGLVVLINIGMHFFGGGYLFYAIMMALMGIAFYIQGLFSVQMLSWVGVVMISLGLGSIVFGIAIAQQEWLTICVFGVGMPLLAFLLNWQPATQTLTRRVLMLLGWLILVVTISVILNHLDRQLDSSVMKIVTLADYQQGGEPQQGMVIVSLPAGTTIPVGVQITGDVLKETSTVIVPLRLAEPMDIVVRDGKPEGHFRRATGPWKEKKYHFRIEGFELSSSLLYDKGPAASLKFRITTGD